MKLIDRFVLGQVIPIFLLGVMAFTGLILGAGAITTVIRLAIDYNADIGLVVLVIVYKLPEIITYTMPMATLFAVILTFSRMSGDLEITATRAAGVSFLRLLVPALAFAYIVSLSALFINDKIVPFANNASNDIKRRIQNSDDLENRDFELRDFRDGQMVRIINIAHIKGKNFNGITIQEFKDNEPVRYITAKNAVWTQKSSLILSDIQTIMFYPGRSGAARNTFVSTPDKMTIPFNYSKKHISNSKKQVNELPIRDLMAFVREMKRQGAQEKDTRKLYFDLHSKLAIPFASFAFAMIAAPLALRPQRASSSVGLGISLVFILMYYILQQLFRALGMQYMSPVVAAWFPDALLFVVGGWLCIKARK